MRLWLLVVLLANPCLALALAADPLEEFPVSLQKRLPSLADAVHAVGLGQTDRCLDALKIEENPVARTAEELAKIRESFHKMLAPISQLKLKFESYDIVAVLPMSSQAMTVFGVANGKRGPVHWDFDLFYYEGQWHMHSMHFTIGWKRERTIPERAVYFDKPHVLRLDQREVAQQSRRAE